jgi:hypothetical protein
MPSPPPLDIDSSSDFGEGISLPRRISLHFHEPNIHNKHKIVDSVQPYA